MSNASNRNFGLAQTERERRLAMALDDPGDMTSAQAVNSDPGWQAFFGSLRQKEQDANAAGLNFRANLSGLGRDGSDGMEPMPGAAQSAQGQAFNVGLGRLTDQHHEQLLREQAQRQALQQDAVTGLQKGYDQQVNASETAPLVDQPNISANADGSKVTMRPSSNDPTAQALARMDPISRLKAQQEIDIASLAERKQTEAERENKFKDSVYNADVKDAVAGMKAGTLPPQLPGRASKEYLSTLAEAKRQGYDLAAAATDWTATQKHIATMNGAQQLRLNQSVNALPEMLDSVETLAKQWDAGKFPLLNKANLALAKGGAYGPDAASIATRLESQIADVTADLGNVYMGGNSPTDHALELAGKNLSGDWEKSVLLDNIKQARQNVQIRRNSINNTGVAGASAGNPYDPQQAQAAPGAAPQVAAPPAAGAPNEGAQKPIPSIPGGIAEFRGGKWVRVK